MSRPKYDWWPYAKGMIRRYPALKREYLDLHSTSITPAYSSMPHGSEVSRTVENIALTELPKTQQREFAAVCKAIATTERYRNGLDRLKLIKLMYWEQTHSMQGAALSIPVSYDTAKEWNREFIRLVGANFGLMD